MIKAKKLGIWIDHSSACITDLKSDPLETTTINSNFTHEDREHTLSRSENIMHNKEKHHYSEFYRKIGDVIRNYDDVLLFGPTGAKVELYNILKLDHLFADINIEIRQTDKMSVGQQHAFIRKHFDRGFDHQ
jgi:hypothetical protein